MGQQTPAGGDTFGALVRRWRQRALLSQDELADRAGLSARTVRNVEAGRVPRLETARLLADALQLAGPELDEFTAAAHLGVSAQSGPAASPLRRAVVESPSLLPLEVPGFVGRQEHLASLDQLLGDGGDVPRVATVSGTAGVGKTALAVHWAHRVRARFPDGQLYLDLRGFDPTDGPVNPLEAVRVFLDALAVPTQRIPSGLTEQIGLFRSLVADRRILVVLDNARDAEQVRPLIPGAAAARVVITSRNPLVGLVAAEGARSVTLDAFDPVEAHELLTSRLGAGWAGDDPATAAQVIERCGGLPLALALLAARLLAHRGFTLQELAGELRTATDPLEVMANGQDRATDLRQVFSWSYLTLSDAGRRTFRLLGLHPGPHVSREAAASLGGHTPTEARAVLNELHDAGLLTEIRPGEYVLHDLLRAYARDVVEETESVADRSTAVHRLLDHYLLTAVNANNQVGPHRQPIDVAEPIDGAVVLPMHDREAAVEWFTREHAALVRAVELAATEGFDRHAWQLAWALVEDLDLRAHWRTMQVTQTVAIEAIRRLDDRHAEGVALRHLANANIRLGELDQADRCLHRALEVFEQLDDVVSQATTQINLTYLREHQGRLHESNRHAERALALYRAAGRPDGEAQALNSVGYGYALTGDYQAALDRCAEALQLVQKIGDLRAEAHTLDSLGYIHHRLGDLDQAARFYGDAAGLHRSNGDRYNQADVLLHLGDVHAEAGRQADAVAAWQEAADLLTALDDPRADEAHERLATRRP